MLDRELAVSLRGLVGGMLVALVVTFAFGAYRGWTEASRQTCVTVVEAGEPSYVLCGQRKEIKTDG